MKVSVVQGDISQVPADALVTAINSSGFWAGGIDNVIRRRSGNWFHEQAANRPEGLVDGEAFVARDDRSRNRRSFQHVVFVVDDLKLPLRQIVRAGLGMANHMGFESVSLPAIRTGVMLGVVEKTIDEAVAGILDGIRCFDCPSGKLKSVNIVVYNDPQLIEKFESALKA